MSASSQRPLQAAVETFLASIQDFESAYDRERERAETLEKESREAHLLHDRLLKENDARVRRMMLDENKWKSTVYERERETKELSDRLHAVTTELDAARSELSKYRAAWSEVLLREKEAKLIISESRGESAKLKEAEQTALRHRRDLEGALDRLREATAEILRLREELARTKASASSFGALSSWISGPEA